MGRMDTLDKVAGAVTIRRSARARRISLRVSRLDGRATLTLPRGVSEAEGLRFLAEKKDWLSRARSGLAPARHVDIGAQLPVLGVARTVVAGPGRRAVLSDDTIAAPAARPGPAVLALLKMEARTRLAEAVARHSAVVGRRPGRLTLRDTRSRWGSCSSAGDLMFSWRLILAPEAVLDYVAAHEVAHLVHMDHSRAFWAVTERLVPDWRTHRDWLRVHGDTLHAWRFDTPSSG